MPAPHASDLRTRDTRPPLDAAVIDIGSNSVRLVLYRLEGRAIWTVFNEKVLAGLGADLAETGRLAPEGVEQALAALKRFKAVLDAAQPTEVFVVATAAVREASDGPAFVRRLKIDGALSVRVLTGEEEARYAALGVLAGAPDAEGVVGDLGGSSLELVRVANGTPAKGVSLPLGAFALRGPDGFDLGRARSKTAKILDGARAVFSAETLYAVGGGWRNLALLQMRMAGYPLQIVHQYEISAATALDAARFIARQSTRLARAHRGRLQAPARHHPLRRGRAGGPDRAVGAEAHGPCPPSACAKGSCSTRCPRRTRALDPLIEGCAALSARQGVSEDIGLALAGMAQAGVLVVGARFRRPRADARRRRRPARRSRRAAAPRPSRRPGVRAGAARPDRRHEPCRADVPGGRAVRAPHRLAQPAEPRILGRVLTHERLERALALGAAIRLGCDLSGRSGELLSHSKLAVAGDALALTADARWADMLLGEQTAKRAAQLADRLELGLKIGG